MSMNKLYTALLTCTLPYWLLRLKRRAKTLPAYNERWSERFGHYDQAPFASQKPLHDQTIWLHTVSVGEFLAARPLINKLLEDSNHFPLVITTTTPSGSQQVVKTYGDKVQHVYIPFDLPWMLKRFIKHFNPKLCLIMETELWPNLIGILKAKHIPSVLINARLSEKSATNYKKIKKTARVMMQNIITIIAQNKEDGQRFLDLGLRPDQLVVAGNIKFDMNLPDHLEDDALSMAQHLNKQQRKTFVVASTHEGEEKLILKAFEIIKKSNPEVFLILVPRHPDRFDQVFSLCESAGFKVGRRSQQSPLDHDCDIVIGDSMGELMVYYAIADVTFVGGSLMPIGGHNLIEPAMLSLPILTGPHLHNFVELKNLMLAADAIIICENEQMVAQKVLELLDHDAQAKALGERAKAVAQNNRGALQRHWNVITKM
jgi:3-deoxy-D-manno-octulosonic-acid transferase